MRVFAQIETGAAGFRTKSWRAARLVDLEING